VTPAGRLPDEIARAVATFESLGPAAFRFLGRRHQAEPDAGADAEAKAGPPRTEIRRALSEAIYASLHCRRPDTATAPGYHDWAGARDFARALSDANRGAGAWEPGWVVRALADDGRVVAERHGLRFWVDAQGFRAGETAVKEGAVGSVRLPKEQRHRQPGFYIALGNVLPGARDRLLRVYWHLQARGAAPLMAELTARLNADEIPFWHKVVSDPRGFTRADAGVTYLATDAWQAARAPVEASYRSVRAMLRSPTSAFALPLGRGVGVAEDVGDGQSFGNHRSRLLAEAMLSAAAAEAPTAEACAGAVGAALLDAGLRPDALHLAPGASERYRAFDD
jgi:hypothetical protein